jgi:hypothetical protein
MEASRKVYDRTGGWGEDGFYQMPVFVLTQRPHDVVLKGRTVFTFVTQGMAGRWRWPGPRPVRRRSTSWAVPT